MRNKQKAIDHLMQAHGAAQSGDGALARHHTGKALAHLHPGTKMSGNWIKEAVGKNPGALHRKLGVPEGETIPAKKIAKAANSDNPTLAKEANLAKTLKKLNRRGK